MSWLIFAALTALCESLKDVFSKRGLKQADEYMIAFALRFFALPFLLPILLFIDIPALNWKFWTALVVGGGMNVFITILYMKAIKASDISITVPMVTFTPLFLLITSPIIVGEFPGGLGIAGIFLIVFGSYMLNISKRKHGFLAPFKALVKEKGPRLMLLVAFLWSITANIDKVGAQNSSAMFWVVSFSLFLFVCMVPVVFLKSKMRISQVISGWRSFLPVGMFSGLTSIFQITAITMTLVPYVISVKRTSAVLSVLWGCLFFREKGLKERLLGAVIMIAGVVLITLS
jgi:uncharacterized membrane protein